METIYRRNTCWMYRNSVFGKKGHVQDSSNDKFTTLQLVKGRKNIGVQGTCMCNSFIYWNSKKTFSKAEYK